MRSQVGGSGSKPDVRLVLEGCALLRSSQTQENSNSICHFECVNSGWFIPPPAASSWEEEVTKDPQGPSFVLQYLV